MKGFLLAYDHLVSKALHDLAGSVTCDMCGFSRAEMGSANTSTVQATSVLRVHGESNMSHLACLLK